MEMSPDEPFRWIESDLQVTKEEAAAKKRHENKK